MTLSDWAVIAICLAGGYWLMSLFLDRPAAKTKPVTGEPPDERRRSVADAPTGEAAPPWWEVLEVPRDASMDEIRQAYRLRMSEYHPDKVSALGTELRDLASRKAKDINAAYDEACRTRDA